VFKATALKRQNNQAISPKIRSPRKNSERQTKFRRFLALNLNDTSYFWGNIITYRLLRRYKSYEPSADRNADKQKQQTKQLSIRHVTLQDGNLDPHIRFENNRRSLTWINV
jgi:hypothetical protein